MRLERASRVALRLHSLHCQIEWTRAEQPQQSNRGWPHAVDDDEPHVLASSKVEVEILPEERVVDA